MYRNCSCRQQDELRIFKKDSLVASKSSVARSVTESPSAICEAERTKTPVEVLEPLEDELSLAFSSLPFPDSDVTLSDLENANTLRPPSSYYFSMKHIMTSS